MNSELSIPINEKAENANGFCRLSWLQRIGFGSGDLAQNLIYQTISMYLSFSTPTSTDLLRKWQP